MKAPLLLHGTDARIIKMSDEERASLLRDCFLVADSVAQMYLPFIHDGLLQLPLFCKINKYSQIYQSLIIAANKNFLRTSNCAQYQYGHTYLTDNRMKAVSYASHSFAFGEIGFCAYILANAAYKYNLVKWTADSLVEKAFLRLKNFAEETPQPVIVHCPNLDIEDLEQDTGKPLWGDCSFRFQMVRSKKFLALSLDNAEYLKVNTIYTDWSELERILDS